jgi:peptidoglycan/LPS O-acetylase OafA/YrhL
MDAESRFHLGYRPALDGVRAAAVIAVMLRHAELPVRGGGVVGVETFFVLSGFLITLLMVEEHERSSRVHLLNFYGRRALRLLPALYTVVFVFAVYAAFFVDQPQRGNTLSAVPSVIFYFANWQRAYVTGLGMFSHTWSLAVEEQFYLVWPLVFIVVLALTNSYRWLAGVATGLLVVSVITRVVIWDAGASVARVQGGFDSRASGLLVGCVAGIAVARSRHVARERATPLLVPLGLLGALGLVAACLLPLPSMRVTYSWGLGVMDVAAICLIVALVLAPASMLGRAFSLGPAVAIGRISYGLYLWHFPVFWAVGAALLGAPRIVLCSVQFAAAFGCAIASYLAIERPALRLKVRMASRAGVPSVPEPR